MCVSADQLSLYLIFETKEKSIYNKNSLYKGDNIYMMKIKRNNRGNPIFDQEQDWVDLVNSILDMKDGEDDNNNCSYTDEEDEWYGREENYEYGYGYGRDEDDGEDLSEYDEDAYVAWERNEGLAADEIDETDKVYETDEDDNWED